MSTPYWPNIWQRVLHRKSDTMLGRQRDNGVHESHREHEILRAVPIILCSAVSPACQMHFFSCSLALAIGIPDRLLPRTSSGHHNPVCLGCLAGTANKPTSVSWTRAIGHVSSDVEGEAVQACPCIHRTRWKRCFFTPCRHLARLRNNLKLAGHR